MTCIVPRNCSRCFLLCEMYKIGVRGLVTLTGIRTLERPTDNGWSKHAASQANIWRKVDKRILHNGYVKEAWITASTEEKGKIWEENLRVLW